MSRVSLASLLATSLAACSTPHLVPLAPGGQAPPEGAVVRAAGLALTALPAAWAGIPGDLPRSVTPLPLIVANEGEAPTSVRFEDFLLLDGGNREYRALTPLEVVTSLYGSAEPPPAVVPAFHRSGQPFFFHGFFADPFFHPFAPYYPYYAPAPYGWPPGRDILRLALREGRVLPGHRVEGFLFFQHAAGGAGPFTLSWTPREPATGRLLATLSLLLALRS